MNNFGNYGWWMHFYRRTYQTLNQFRPELDPDERPRLSLRVIITIWVVITIIGLLRFGVASLGYLVPILIIGCLIRFLASRIRRS